MQRYPVRRDHVAGLAQPSLERAAQASFGSGGRDGEFVVANFGALEALRARAAGKELEVETRMNPKVSVDVAAETVKRYNQFLEAVTGYTSKERAKRLRKTVGGSDTES